MASHDTQQVYVIQHELGLVKIGIAERPQQRARGIQTGTPFEVWVRKTARPTNARRVERYLHKHFRQYNVRGEWFDLPTEVRDFEIPTHVDEDMQPNVDVPLPEARDMDYDWAEFFERSVRALTDTRWLTADTDRIRRDWRELGEDIGVRDVEDDALSTNTEPDLEVLESDVDDSKIRCSSCGHQYDPALNSSCPTCDGGSSHSYEGRKPWNRR